jgi:dipeptidyl aminopeptidase/acylaminoacyl peptidase
MTWLTVGPPKERISDMKWLLGSVAIGAIFVSLIGCQLAGQTSSSNTPTSEPAQLPELPPGVHYETVITPSGDTLRYSISVPQNYKASNPVSLVVALHYGGEVKPFYGGGMIDVLIQPGLGKLRAILVAPDALGGGGWTTSKNEQAVEWLTRSILQSYAIDPRKVAITGYSMGGEGAWHIGGRHQDLFTAVVPVEGDPAGKRLEWKTPVLVIHSRDDEVILIGPVEKHVQNLQAQGGMITLRTVDGLTHYQVAEFARPLQQAVPWLKGMWPE